MPLQEGDLKDTILKTISIDEFQPKTGDEKDVAVLGFSVVQSYPGTDLYNFINGSVVENRDVELSPNPNTDGYYMVFVEMDRNEDLYKNINSILSEVKNVAGDLEWVAKFPYTENAFTFSDDALITKYLQSDPNTYLSPSEFKEKLMQEEVQAEEKALQEQAEENSNTILEFLRDSNLLEAGFKENKLHMRGSKNVATLEVVNFGSAKEVMAELGINESAIKPLDSTLRMFNSMLGEMRAVPIDDYIVIFNPAVTENVLVTKLC